MQSTLNLLAEDQILIYCTQMKGNISKIAALVDSTNLSWDYLLKMARRHCLIPLLHKSIKKLDNQNQIPNEVRQTLEQVYYQTAFHNLIYYGHLRSILQALNEANISVILLKGVALAELVYNDIALRPMADIDILIPIEEMQAAHEIFTQLGYAVNEFDEYSKWHYLQGYVVRHIKYIKGSVGIEVHPRISDVPQLNPWSRAVWTTIDSIETRILGPEVFLCHLCCHLDGDVFGGRYTLYHWVDITTLVNYYRQKINWDLVLQITRMHSLDGTMYRILSLSSQWFEADIPSEVLQQLHRDKLLFSIQEIINPVLHKGYSRLDKSGIDTHKLVLNSVPRIHNKLRYLFYIVFPWKPFMLYRYSIKHPRLLFFYYLWRLIAYPFKMLCYSFAGRKK